MTARPDTTLKETVDERIRSKGSIAANSACGRCRLLCRVDPGGLLDTPHTNHFQTRNGVFRQRRSKHVEDHHQGWRRNLLQGLGLRAARGLQPWMAPLVRCL